MIKKLNNISKYEYNRILFQVKRTPGDARRAFPSRGIHQRPIPEGYYMKPRVLSKDSAAPEKTNPIIKLFKYMAESYRGVIEAMKPEA